MLEQPAPFTLPTPPPGMQWHRTDGWKAEMLPPGARPLALGENYKPGDECFIYKTGDWIEQSEGAHGTAQSHHTFIRTTRPLLFQHEGHEWQWHRAGDKLPEVRGENPNIEVLTDATSDIGFHIHRCVGISYIETLRDIGWQVLGWRYADAVPAPKQPLGPEDVPPFSLIRRKPEQDNGQQWHWRAVSYVTGIGPHCGDRGYNWEELQRDYEINRPKHRDSSGNPTLWEPCHK